MSLTLSTIAPAAAEKVIRDTISRGTTRWMSALTAVNTIAPRVEGSASRLSVAMRADIVTAFGDTRS